MVSFIHQRTLAQTTHFDGKGLHSGRVVSMSVEPLEASSGIWFERVDTQTPRMRATVENVSSTLLSTTLGQGSQTVSTTEHLLAALSGLGIDNALIKLNGPEVPIMDGSSQVFIKAFQAAGVVNLKPFKTCIKIERPFEFRKGDGYIRVSPSDSLEVSFGIDFPYKVVGKQHLDYLATSRSFLELANARTFCHIDDVQTLRQKGLALGGSLQNSVVITQDGIANEDGLRSENEFVRHKLLDLIGDFCLLEASLLAKVQAFKSGHHMHVEFMRALLNEPSYFKILTTQQLDVNEAIKRRSSRKNFQLTYA